MATQRFRPAPSQKIHQRGRSKFLKMSDPKHEAIVTAPHVSSAIMHPMVQAAMALGPDPSVLRELLALQRDWEKGEAEKAYTRALTALKRDLPTVIHRDAVVHYTTSKGTTNYTHSSLAAVMDAVTGPLTQHGFSLSWSPSTTGQGGGSLVTVTCRLTHADGHYEETTISAPPDTSGSKSPAQAVASTITLLSRYTALSLLGIATADMSEPEGRGSAPAPGAVDANRNLQVMTRLVNMGKTKQQAEAYVSRPVNEWTTEDIDKLRDWVAPKPPPAADPNDDGRVPQ